jgi:selenocysteine lyase/cysteine desulfurase
MAAQLGDRSLFEGLKASSYLNHAAVSPLPQPVRRAIVVAATDVGERGVFAIIDSLQRREELRSEVADWLGATPDDIGFPPGTNRGILDVALAIDWQPGDRVICFEGEFPANVEPWLQAMQRVGGEVVLLPLQGFDDGSGDGLQRVSDALTGGGVRLVAVSAVQFASGLRMPVEALGALAHAHGAELFVDAIQAVGAGPVPLTNIDYLVAGTHKWLMSADGLAVAYAAPEARRRLRPQTAGWLSHDDAMGFLGRSGALRYDRPIVESLDWMEGGTQSMLAFAALQASVSLLRGLGVERIAAHVQQLHDALEPPLVELGLRSLRANDPAARSGSLVFELPPPVSAREVSRRLAEQGVVVGTPEGRLRLSPHWPNHRDEVPVVVDAMRRALSDR